MNGALEDAIGEALGARVSERRAVGGGDVNEAWAVSLSDGRRVFVKTNPGAPETMFPREADGLAWLRVQGGPRIPEVLAVDPRFLVLERIEVGRPAPDHDERLGRELAALHRATPEGFGGPALNFVGRLHQDNRPLPDWASFYRERRLAPLLRRAADEGLASRAMRDGMEAVFARMESLVEDPAPPARLHGDLWGGNAIVDEAGAPVLIDPAVYGGHREIDLAMMRLFGGFGRRVFASYEEAWPLAAGAEARVALYQLYPLMVHVCMFGGGYVGGVERQLEAVLRSA